MDVSRQAVLSPQAAPQATNTTQQRQAPAPPQTQMDNINNTSVQQRTENISQNGHSQLSYQRDEDISDQMLEQTFQNANRVLAGSAFRLSYGIHEATNRLMVAVYDADTDEVIREIPSESRLDTYAKISEFVGLIFDQQS
jgi:flagellar protein FlaG